jgi:iron complex transport system ATP-binding protein
MSLLNLTNLTVNIHHQFICRDLTLGIHPGETWGILGANGSGKTTLLHTLAGLRPAFAGNITLNNQSLRTLTPRTIAQSIAILFQDYPTIFPQTVWEYCLAARFPHRAYFNQPNADDHRIVHQALNKMALTALSQKEIQQLSGGEKRRLALAAVLSQTPTLYLLDEPTNHLDLRHQKQTLDCFRELAQTQTAAIMMTLHDVNLAQQYCDHILLLFDDGDVLFGKTKEVLTTDHLSHLYQCSMQIITHHDQTYWHAGQF